MATKTSGEKFFYGKKTMQGRESICNLQVLANFRYKTKKTKNPSLQTVDLYSI